MFTLTLNAAFALGFALLGPIVVTLVGAPALILLVAACYLVAAGFCWTLPPVAADEVRDGGRAGPTALTHDAEAALGSTLVQLREGITFIRGHRSISWSLTYLAHRGVADRRAGRARPRFATDSLGLEPKDFVVIVLPLGFGDRDRDPAAQLVRAPARRAAGSSSSVSSPSAS